jgi:2-polyprenyl-3-methyl-5-hydroxy-6-metoxy-1,4-benzoquinol methylase
MRDDKYPLVASPAEIERLRIQAESLSDEAAIMLNRIGIQPGMACLDLGCGAGGITDLLSARVGSAGRVLGVDVEEFSLAAARVWADRLGLANVSFRAGSIFANDLAPESFDLVHLRYVITTIGRHEEVVRSALRLVKPGGALALQEADSDGIQCFPDNATFTHLRDVLASVFAGIGGDTFAGRQVFRLLCDAGLSDVDVRVCTARSRSTDDLVDYVPQTVLSVRQTIRELGLMADGEIDYAIAEVRAHLSDPKTITTTSTVFQAWGRKAY